MVDIKSMGMPEAKGKDSGSGRWSARYIARPIRSLIASVRSWGRMEDLGQSVDGARRRAG